MSSCKCVVCGDMFNRDIVQPISVCKKCRDKSLQAFDKWAECMAISRSSAFRLLKRAHIAVNNRYQRMKGADYEQREAD